MKKKTIWLCSILAVVVALIAGSIVDSVLTRKHYEEQYNYAYIALFVTERNEVALLYQSLNQTIDTPNDENYARSLEIVKQTEEACMLTYASNSNLVETYGAGSFYYATFFRDIKATLAERSINDLLNISELLGIIISLYDSHSNPVTINEKIKSIEEFYKSLSMLNDKMKSISDELNTY